MDILQDNILHFFREQECVIVSTVDADGFLHTACKGIVEINSDGSVYLFDLYRGETLSNLKRDPHISITAIDVHDFIGYCLKGKIHPLSEEGISPQLVKDWESRIASRLTRRVIRNIQQGETQGQHPEALLPKPQYLIAMQVEKVVELRPRHLKQD